MANIYVSAVDGNNADSGADWANAKQTVAGALAIAADLDVILVDSAGAFSSAAAITWDVAVADRKVGIVSVNRSGSDAWTAGAKETVGVNAASFTVAATRGARLYVYGMTLEGNNGASASNTVVFGTTAFSIVDVMFVYCTISSPGSSTSATIRFGQSSSAGPIFRFRDCTWTLMNAAAPAVQVNLCTVECYGLTLAYAGATKPTALIAWSTTVGMDFTIADSDLSGFNSGNLCNVGSLYSGRVLVRNCKLHATPGIVTGTWGSNSTTVTLINVSSADTDYVFSYYNRLGTLSVSTATYANGGASRNGISVSWSIVTTSACNKYEPFYCPWLMLNSASTSAMNIRAQLLWDSATDLKNTEAWIETEYVSDASFPKGTCVSSRAAEPITAAGTDLDNSSVTWTEAMANDNEMYCQTAVTPAAGSLLRTRLVVGRASTTVYLDPTIYIDDTPQATSVAWDDIGSIGLPAGGGGLKLVGAGGLAG